MKEFLRSLAALSCVTKRDLKGWPILITAGPTVEDIDPVRFISNRSSGRMGVALATAAARRGALVTLIHGPLQVPLPCSRRIRSIAVRSADEMLARVMEQVGTQRLAIFCAAVCDFKPARRAEQKLKKEAAGLNDIEWVRTPDILAAAGALRPRPFLIGFAAETEEMLEHAHEKLIRKNCDMICANDVASGDGVFGSENNRVTIITPKGSKPLPLMSKLQTAEAILDAAHAAIEAQE